MLWCRPSLLRSQRPIKDCRQPSTTGTAEVAEGHSCVAVQEAANEELGPALSALRGNSFYMVSVLLAFKPSTSSAAPSAYALPIM